MRTRALLLIFGFVILSVLPAWAVDNFYFCEVANVSGDVQLKRAGQPAGPVQQGMTIRQGDTLVVAAGASADLAFDPQWKNVSHLNEKTSVLVRRLSPVRLEMSYGDVYSKLDQLPRGSTFEVTTPIAVATVRGTKFRTTYENGKTTIFNDSETSEVYVYHLDEHGNRSGRAIVLKPGESVVIDGAVQVEESMLEETQDSRDREDQDQLRDNLDRMRPTNSDNPPSEPCTSELCN